MVFKSCFMRGFSFLLLLFLQPVSVVGFSYNMTWQQYQSQTWQQYQSQVQGLEKALNAAGARPQVSDITRAIAENYYAIDSDFIAKINPHILRECANVFASVALSKRIPVFCYYIRRVFKDEDFSKWNYWHFKEFPIALQCFTSSVILKFNLKEFYLADIFYDSNVIRALGLHNFNALNKPGELTDYFDDLLPEDPSMNMIKAHVSLAVVKIMADYWKRENFKDEDVMQRLRPYYMIDPFLIVSIPPDKIFSGLIYTSGVVMRNSVGALLLDRLASFSPDVRSAKNLGTSLIRMLGQLATGLDPGVLAALDPEVVKANIDLWKRYNFDKVQTEKLAAVLYKSYGDGFSVETMKELDFIARGLSAEQLRKINLLDSIASRLDVLAFNEVPMKVVAYQILNANSGNFLKLKRLAAIVSPSALKNKFSDAFVHDNIKEAKTVIWTQEQAIVLLRKYKQVINRPLNVSDLPVVGTLIKGIARAELMNMMKSQLDIIHLAYNLTEEEATSAQIQEIVMAFIKVTSLSEHIKVGLTHEEAYKLSRHLAHTHPSFLKSVKLTKRNENIFIQRLSSMSIVKLPVAQIKFLSKFLRQIILKDPNIAPEDQDVAMISRLGVMALGLTPDDIRSFSPATVVKSLNILGQLPLSASQSLAVMQMLNKTEPNWKCRLDIVGRTGTILQFNSDVFKINCHETIARSATRFIEQIIQRDAVLDARKKAGFVKSSEIENSEKGMEGFVTKIVDALARATPTKEDFASSKLQLKNFKCVYLRMLKSAVFHVAPGYFTYMPQSELAKCIPYLGQVKRWTADHVEALLYLILEYTGIDFKRWTEERIQDMGSLLSGLTAAQLSELRINEVESLNRICNGPRLSYDKSQILLQNWISRAKSDNIGQIKSDEFSSLSQLISAFTPLEISKLADTVIMDGLKAISKQKCAHEVAQAYYDRLRRIMTNSNVNTWPIETLIEAAPLICFVKPDEILTLSPHQLADLPAEAIYEMPLEFFQRLTALQLTFLTPVQNDAIKEAQYNSLDKNQRAVLEFYAAYAKCSVVKSGAALFIMFIVVVIII